MRRLVVVLGIVCVSSLTWVTAASAAAGDATCTGTVMEPGTAPLSVINDLVVPAGNACTIGPGSTIGHSVIVNTGATLINNGGHIGWNVQATSPNAIVMGAGTTADGTRYRGYVGNDLKVNGVTGSGPPDIAPGTNFVCSTDVVHDVVLTNGAMTAGEWIVGDVPELCTQGNLVGHDLVVQNNKNALEISDNCGTPSLELQPTDPGPLCALTASTPLAPPYGIGHDLRVTGNAQAPVVEGNTVFHDAVCQSNFTTDLDHELDGLPDGPNVSGHVNSCRKG